MNTLLVQTIDRDMVAFNGKTIFFAFGEDPFLYWILFWVAGFFIFMFLGDALQSLLRKKQIFSGRRQLYLPYILVFALLMGGFVFMHKTLITPQINIPIEERRNLITIDLPEKKVTIKKNHRIVEQYTLSPNDYFYVMTLDGNKSTSYSLLLIHNNTQKEVFYSNHVRDIQIIETLLLEQGFLVMPSR